MTEKAAKKIKTSDRSQYQSNPFSLMFSTFKQVFDLNVGPAVALMVLPLVVAFVGSALLLLLVILIMISANSHIPNEVIFFGFYTLFILLMIFYGLIYQSFSAVLSISSLRSKKIDIIDAFKQSVKYIWKLFLSSVLTQLIVFGCFLPFILSAIGFGYLEYKGLSGLAEVVLSILLGIFSIISWILCVVFVFRFSLSTYFIVDSNFNYGPVEAMKKSFGLTKNRLTEILAISLGGSLASSFIPIAGVLLLSFGLSGWYEQMLSWEHKREKLPKIHISNYLTIAGSVALFFAWILINILVQILPLVLLTLEK